MIREQPKKVMCFEPEDYVRLRDLVWQTMHFALYMNGQCKTETLKHLRKMNDIISTAKEKEL